eukprot:TRINITY_DN2048_c0_g1_i1.p1 TRINITY_DN2048_c0_g1~~TRINITY_DN2048_c0_g1_i1.p1  ORF type:complete len:208 (+),score=42.38 TRINITY_DN2048_c0_g1_i1:41-625(+)
MGEGFASFDAFWAHLTERVQKSSTDSWGQTPSDCTQKKLEQLSDVPESPVDGTRERVTKTVAIYSEDKKWKGQVPALVRNLSERFGDGLEFVDVSDRPSDKTIQADLVIFLDKKRRATGYYESSVVELGICNTDQRLVRVLSVMADTRHHPVMEITYIAVPDDDDHEPKTAKNVVLSEELNHYLVNLQQTQDYV